MAPPSTSGSASRRDHLLLGLLLLACGVLATLPASTVSALMVGLRDTVLAPVLAVHASAGDVARLKDELDRLRAERDSLARIVAGTRSLRAENRELRRNAGLPVPRADSLVTVEIVPGRGRGGESRSFVVRGLPPDLELPAGVFTDAGVVGAVRSAQGDRGLGDFWTHPDFRVSVRTEEGGATGIVRPHAEFDQPGMLLEGAPYQETIPEGTLLVTTGLGGVFPPGVPVGAVVAPSGVESGWERSYRVRPRVRPGEAGVAFVRRRAPVAP